MGKILDLKVHHYRKMKDPRNPAAMIVKLIKTNPYARLSSGGEILFVQGGKAMFADGVIPDKVPAWAIEAMSRMDVDAARECGADIVLAAANVSHNIKLNTTPGEEGTLLDEDTPDSPQPVPMVAGD